MTPEQLEAFQSSQTHKDIVGYIETLNEAVIGVKLTDKCAQSDVRCSLRCSWGSLTKGLWDGL